MRLTEQHERLVERLGRRAGTAVWLVAWFVGLLALTCAVGAVLVAVAGVEETPWDVATLDAFHRGRTPARSRFWSVVTRAGGSAFVVPFVLVVAVVWWLRYREDLALQLLGGAYLGGALLANLGKRIVGRERPAADLAFSPETGLAFPSGHATNAAAVYTALALLLAGVVVRRAWRLALGTVTVAVTVLVAVSRLYLGAHWVSDVVAGTVVGAVWATVLWGSLTARAGPYPRS